MLWREYDNWSAVLEETTFELLSKPISAQQSTVTEADVSSFIWLSPQEKEKVLALARASGAAAKNYLKKVMLRGNLLGLRYSMPEDPDTDSYPNFAKLLVSITGEASKLLVPEEWDTPPAKRAPPSKIEDSDSETDAFEKEIFLMCGGQDHRKDEEENEPYEGTVTLDDASKAKVKALAEEAVELYRSKVWKNNPEHPGNKLEAALAEEKEINRLLSMAGIKKPEKTSKCVRAGLIRGNFGFKFTGDSSQLDIVVREEKCSEFSYGDCKGTLTATIRKLLEQPDYAGNDYECNSEDASVKCTDSDCEQGQYMSRCCEGKPDWDDGKSHNHCRKCPGLGMCIYDYREAHCKRCSDHYYRGFSSRFPCNCASVFRMISKAGKGDRAALAALYFYKEYCDADEYEDYSDECAEEEEESS